MLSWPAEGQITFLTLFKAPSEKTFRKLHLFRASSVRISAHLNFLETATLRHGNGKNRFISRNAVCEKPQGDRQYPT